MKLEWKVLVSLLVYELKLVLRLLIDYLLSNCVYLRIKYDYLIGTRP